MPPPFLPLYNDQGRQLNHGAILSSQIWTTPVTPSQYHCTGRAHISHRSINAHTGVLKWTPLPNSSRTSCLCPPKLAHVCVRSLSLPLLVCLGPREQLCLPILAQNIMAILPTSSLGSFGLLFSSCSSCSPRGLCRIIHSSLESKTGTDRPAVEAALLCRDTPNARFQAPSTEAACQRTCCEAEDAEQHSRSLKTWPGNYTPAWRACPHFAALRNQPHPPVSRKALHFACHEATI